MFKVINFMLSGILYQNFKKLPEEQLRKFRASTHSSFGSAATLTVGL